MNVAYCITKDYIDKVKPSIRSLKDNNPDSKIYIVTETDTVDIPDVTVIDISNQEWFPRSGINYFNQFTYIGFLKVCYQTLIPEDKLIHMDADTVIVDSLEPMWNINLEGKWYAMCNERQQTFYKPFGENYYNAGVMLLNLKQLREDDIQFEMVRYLNKIKQPWCEQDAFNKYGIEQDKIVEMDIRFNEAKTVGTTDNPAVIHYCTYADWFDNKDIFRHEYLERYKGENA